LASTDLDKKKTQEVSQESKFPDYDFRSSKRNLAPFLNFIASEGHYVSKDDGTVRDEVELVVLAEKTSRQLFPPKFKEDDKAPPACKSDDGLHATGDPNAFKDLESMPNQAGDLWLCDTCPLQNFTEKEAPRCSEIAVLLCVDVEFQTPIVVRLKRTGLKPWFEFRTSLDKTRKVSNRATMQYVIKCSASEDAFGSTKYYRPAFEVAKELSDDETVPYAEAARGLVQGFRGQDVSAESDIEAEAVEVEADDDIDF